jgi:hypothetical protein
MPGHFEQRFKSLIAADTIRAMQLLEITQYGFLYILVSFFIGSFVDTFFSLPDEKAPTDRMLFEVILQSLLFVISVFYIRKLVKLIPIVISMKGYNAYETSEYGGEMIIAVVLVATQFGLLKKIDILSRRFYKDFLGIEKRLGI